MKTLSKLQFKNFMDDYPDGGVVFQIAIHALTRGLHIQLNPWRKEEG